MRDSRARAALFYDLSPQIPVDVPFYLARVASDRIASPECRVAPDRVLELGSGTGRVTLPLAERCGFIHGIDLSEAMTAICLEKIREAKLAPERIKVEVGDITDLHLDARFDLVIAPFRVLQALEHDTEVAGLFNTIRDHLAPGGRAILSAFNPNRSPEELRTEWVCQTEEYRWEAETNDGRVVCFDRRTAMDTERLVLYPDLIYRRYEPGGDAIVEEIVHSIVMRCHYPDELVRRVETAGFRVTGKWGGYADEPYGEGSELVVEFTAADA